MNEQPERRHTEMVQRSSWARDFTGTQCEMLARYGKVRQLEEGETVFHEGDNDVSMYLILRGRVSVTKMDSSGRSRELVSLGAGQTFGEMSLIEALPRSATIRAAEETLVLQLEQDRFQELVEHYPAVGYKLLFKIARAMSERLRQTSGALVEVLNYYVGPDSSIQFKGEESTDS